MSAREMVSSPSPIHHTRIAMVLAQTASGRQQLKTNFAKLNGAQVTAPYVQDR